MLASLPGRGAGTWAPRTGTIPVEGAQAGTALSLGTGGVRGAKPNTERGGRFLSLDDPATNAPTHTLERNATPPPLGLAFKLAAGRTDDACGCCPR
jgi:hypothetical protein